MTHRLHSPRSWLGLAAGVALALGSAGTLAGDMKGQSAAGDSPARTQAPADAGTHKSLKELQTAQVHTGKAAEAKQLNDAKTHLQRAANCLVGTNSPDFQATANDPCADTGKGAIADSTDPRRASLAKEALSQIKDGLQASNLSGAQKSAKDATDTLRTATKGVLMDNE